MHLYRAKSIVPLAYMTAKANGLDDECQAILDASGLTAAEISLPNIGAPLPLPSLVVPTHKANWPVKASGVSSFEKALLEDGGQDAGIVDGPVEEDATPEGHNATNGDLGMVEDEETGGWDMGDDAAGEAEDEFVEVEAAEAGAGSSEAEVWTRNSPLAADHVAGGSYDTAMNLLNRQVGAVNFKPLEHRFEEIYLATRTYLAANPNLPSLVNYVRRTLETTESRKLLPRIPQELDDEGTTKLRAKVAAARKLMSGNKLEEGVTSFREILQLVLVNCASSADEAETVSSTHLPIRGFTNAPQAKEIIQSAGQYVLAMSIELSRREVAGPLAGGDMSELGAEKKKRILELSAYFTKPTLEPAHASITLTSAMTLAYKNKQLSSALNFANALLEGKTTAKAQESVSHPDESLNYNMLMQPHRPRRSRVNARERQVTQWRLTLTHSQSSKFVARPTRRYMPEKHARNVHSMASNTSRGSRAWSAKSARSVQSEHLAVAYGSQSDGMDLASQL